MKYGYLLAETEVETEDLPSLVTSTGPISADYLPHNVATPLVAVERRAVLSTLEHLGDDKKQMAEALGVSLKTLYNRLNACSKGD